MNQLAQIVVLFIGIVGGAVAVAFAATWLIDRYLPSDSDRAERDAEELIRNANKAVKRRAF